VSVPCWPGPAFGAMKMSPGATFEVFFRILILGGWRSGRDLKCCTPPGVPPGSPCTCPGTPIGAGEAIWNLSLPLCSPTNVGSAFTETVSPALKCLLGMKLAPLPSECALRTPLCVPVFEPTTLIPVSWLGGAPRKLIWVRALASGVPAIGNTATFDAAPDDDPQPTATIVTIAATTRSADVTR